MSDNISSSSSEASKKMEATESSIVKCDYLHRRVGMTQHWERRHYSLFSDGTLRSSRETLRHTYGIFLMINSCTRLETYGNHPYMFSVRGTALPGAGALCEEIFYCETEKECVEWVDLIRNIIFAPAPLEAKKDAVARWLEPHRPMKEPRMEIEASPAIQSADDKPGPSSTPTTKELVKGTVEMEVILEDGI